MGKQASAVATAAFVSALLVGGGLALASTSNTPVSDSPESTTNVADSTATTAPTTTSVPAPTAEVPATPVAPAPVEVAPPPPPVDTRVVTNPEPEPQLEQPPFDPDARPKDANGDWLIPVPPAYEPPPGPPNGMGDKQNP